MPDRQWIAEILEVHEALNQLAAFDQRKAKIIEMHYFGGMTYEEIACAEHLTVATVKRDLRFALAWFRCNLGPND